jgi:hypothetical protein
MYGSYRNFIAAFGTNFLIAGSRIRIPKPSPGQGAELNANPTRLHGQDRFDLFIYISSSFL